MKKSQWTFLIGLSCGIIVTAWALNSNQLKVMQENSKLKAAITEHRIAECGFISRFQIEEL